MGRGDRQATIEGSQPEHKRCAYKLNPALGLGGYLDIGLIDTMEDLVVNFIGAVVFSVFGFLYVKNRGKKDSIISRFVPRRKSADRDYLRLVIDGGSAADAKAKAGGANADDSANASAAGTDSADAAGAKAGNADAAPTVTAKP